jgi:hypothetical protein
MWDDLPAGLELPTVFVSKRWIDVIQDRSRLVNAQMISKTDRLTEARTALISELAAAGFPIAYDIDSVPENTIHLTNYAYKTGNDQAQWKKSKEDKINRCCGDIIPRPESLPFKEYILDPFFPAVFKSERIDRGIDKFFIETPEQLERIKQLRTEILPNLPPRHQLYFDDCLFQRYIKPPDGLNSSMRVLAAASGDILASGLIYSLDTAVSQRTELSPFDMFFTDPKSPYFLDCKNILSNRAAGGSIIALGAPGYNGEKKRILRAHGIDPSNPVLPDDMAKVAGDIARECNRELGIMCGVDFIYHAEEKKWYYIEANLNPSVGTYALSKGKKIPDDGSLFYLDLDIRRKSLHMCVMKRHQGVI